MKRLMLVMVFAGLMFPAGLMAQKVYKDAGNRVILDLTAAAGMPAKAVTNTAKKWTDTPSNTTGPMTDNGEKGSINATVFQKLEIAPHCLTGDGTIGSAGGVFTWADAFNYCKNVNHNGTGWRLPTQRELQLMYIFRPALESVLTGIGGTVFSAAYYWSATEFTAYYARYVSFSTGVTSATYKSDTYRVRCVREVN